MARITTHFRILGLVSAALAGLCDASAQASTEGQAALPATHAEIIHDNARITFDWPEEVHFSAHETGRKLTITFDREADPDFGQMLSALFPHVSHASRLSDGKTIVLTLEKPYKVQSFSTGTSDGVELIGLSGPGNLTALAPSAGVESAVSDPESDSAPVTAVPTKPSSSTLKVSVSAEQDSAVMRFPFNERVAMAAFTRAHALWIVINKPMPVNLSDFNNLSHSVVSKASLISSSKATIIRIAADETMSPSVAKEDNGFNWVVMLSAKKRLPATPLKILINTEPPAPANIFIPVLETAAPVSMTDPVLGDALIVTPLFNAGEGVAVKREFVEFSLLATAQGVAIAKKSDDVVVAQLRNGLRVALPSGATLTPNLPDTEASDSPSASGATLFPYETWRPDDPDQMQKQIRELTARIVETNKLQEANQLRLKIAQIYLSEGWAPEAIGALDNINRLNPAYYRSAKLASMHGAANFLMYRFSEASRDFASAELNNNQEMDYWRSMLAELTGGKNQNYDYLAMNKDYISHYPPVFRERLAIVAADRAIANKEYTQAAKIFDMLKQDNILDPIDNYATYLLAKVSAEGGHEEDAMDIWAKLAEDFTHPFVRANAEFSRIVAQMDHNTITKDQATDQLERLRLDWHGDGLELRVLSMLGDIYADKKDYVNAMRIWNGGVMSFPNSSESIDMSRHMQEAFTILFNEGAADKLPPLDALSVYYDYRNYAPGGETGNAITEHLADRLVSVDLIEQAAALLDHQMRFQTEKQERSRLGAKLATLYLLNRQPQRAVHALEDSVYGDNPPELKLLRNRLTAQALAGMSESDRALDTLGHDDGSDADRIRLGVYWQQKNWPKVISNIESMLKSRKDLTAPVTVDESEYLLRLALAYVFEKDSVQLQYLRDYFGPLMVNNPNKQVFDFLTNGDIDLTTTNFNQVMQNLADTRSFVDNYHAQIKASGLGSLIQ